MYRDDNTWFDADRLPTMEELSEFFKTHSAVGKRLAKLKQKFIKA